jgi:hypothetical protein
MAVIVWLWDASNACGVTDDESRAQQAAKAFLRDSGPIRRAWKAQLSLPESGRLLRSTAARERGCWRGGTATAISGGKRSTISRPPYKGLMTWAESARVAQSVRT